MTQMELIERRNALMARRKNRSIPLKFVKTNHAKYALEYELTDVQ